MVKQDAKRCADELHRVAEAESRRGRAIRARVGKVLLTGAAVCLTAVPKLVWAQERPAMIRESRKLAGLRSEAKRRSRRVIYNDDGCGPLWAKDGGNTPERFLAGPRSRMAAVPGTQVDSVFFCSGATHVLNHPSTVAESYADMVDRYGLTAGNFDHFRDNMRALEALGTDGVRLTVEFCKEQRREVFYSYRVNDLHLAQGGSMNIERSTWWREHPEYWLGKVANLTEAEARKYPATDLRLWGWASLNFELPEVRAYLLRILDEVVNKYDIDGIEIDCFRAPLFFAPNLDGKPATRKQLACLTDFQRQVRLMALRVAEKRGRPMLVAVRVPTTVSRCQYIGIDIERWLRDDLVDILTLGGGYVPLNADWDELVKLGGRHRVPVYPVLSGSGFRGRYAAIEAWRAAAANAFRAGAAGVYLFNHCPNKPSAQFRELGDPETLAGLDKLFAVENEPSSYWGHSICVMDSSAAHDDPYGHGANIGVKPKGRFLPATLEPEEDNIFVLKVGDDIRRAARDRSLETAVLQAQIGEPSALDAVEVRLNGKRLAELERAAADGWLRFEPRPAWFNTGRNRVSFRLKAGAQAGTGPVELRALELRVTYRQQP